MKRSLKILDFVKKECKTQEEVKNEILEDLRKMLRRKLVFKKSNEYNK
jgi:hypothetical protein